MCPIIYTSHLNDLDLSECRSEEVISFFLRSVNKRVRNLAVSREPWDISEVIRDKHGINQNIPGLGPQKTYSSRATSAAEKACLSRMTPN